MNFFAYGTDMDTWQMRLHCPHALFVGTVKLERYRLCFPRHSFIHDCGVISIEPAKTGEVWGALYELGEGDLQRLDDLKGYELCRDRALNKYNRVTVSVRARDKQVRLAQAYLAVPSPNAKPPSPQYINYLVTAATKVGLPKSHLNTLAQHLPAGADQARSMYAQ